MPPSMQTKEQRVIHDLEEMSYYPSVFLNVARMIAEMPAEEPSAGFRGCSFPKPFKHLTEMVCDAARKFRKNGPLMCTKELLPCSLLQRYLGKPVISELTCENGRTCMIQKMTLVGVEQADVVLVWSFMYSGLFDANRDVDSKHLWDTLVGVSRNENPQQVWAVEHSGESHQYYPYVKDPNFLCHFNISYGEDDRFFAYQTYIYAKSLDDFWLGIESINANSYVVPPPPEFLPKKKFLLYLQSNCGMNMFFC